MSHGRRTADQAGQAGSAPPTGGATAQLPRFEGALELHAAGRRIRMRRASRWVGPAQVGVQRGANGFAPAEVHASCRAHQAAKPFTRVSSAPAHKGIFRPRQAAALQRQQLLRGCVRPPPAGKGEVLPSRACCKHSAGPTTWTDWGGNVTPHRSSQSLERHDALGGRAAQQRAATVAARRDKIGWRRVPPL